MIDNKLCFCGHGGMHPLIARNVNYIPGNVYNVMKETFIKTVDIRVCCDLILVEIFLISLIVVYIRQQYEM